MPFALPLLPAWNEDVMPGCGAAISDNQGKRDDRKASLDDSIKPCLDGPLGKKVMNPLHSGLYCMQPHTIPAKLEHLRLPRVFRVWSLCGFTPQSSSWAAVSSCPINVAVP